MRYAEYVEATGQITQWGVGQPRPGAAYIAHDHEGGLADYYVSNGELAIKPQMTLTTPSAATLADGVSEAVISGIPAGTSVTLFISGEPSYLVVDDGTLEIAVYDPQTVRVSLRHGLFQHDPVEVDFA